MLRPGVDQHGGAGGEQLTGHRELAATTQAVRPLPFSELKSEIATVCGVDAALS
jgi:hypothetical protein